MDALPYRYVGVPLTAAIAAKLIAELFEGKVLERRVIADGALSAHVQRGGASPRGDIAQIARNALKDLRAEGKAVNVSVGHWQIGATASLVEGQQATIADIADATDEIPPATPLPADVLELGEGPHAVYLYYLPTYRKHAEANGKNCWPCKIGRTIGDPLTRIAQQAATALPEPPRMAAVLWTDASFEWERAFHAILAARKKRVVDAPGVEWFDTSPDEFREIAIWIDSAVQPSP
jgi:hypothetical protein